MNADDFGMCRSVNRGIVHAHEHGIVTSASLMVHGAAAGEAAGYARDHPKLSVGLHLDLAEWVYEEEWALRYQYVDTDDFGLVELEVARQLRRFEALVGRSPTHLDSHQHVHRGEPVSSILMAAGEELGVPVRDQSPLVRYRGDFYGQTGKGAPYHEALTIAALCALVAGLPGGVTELGCHPGFIDDLESVYRLEREVEARVLCESAVRQALASGNVRLVGFNDLAGLPAS
ncbi:MAG TPA: ChbG/HpnK family deacetylase [Actinomycetes bacterium]